MAGEIIASQAAVLSWGVCGRHFRVHMLSGFRFRMQGSGSCVPLLSTLGFLEVCRERLGLSKVIKGRTQYS